LNRRNPLELLNDCTAVENHDLDIRAPHEGPQYIASAIEEGLSLLSREVSPFVGRCERDQIQVAGGGEQARVIRDVQVLEKSVKPLEPHIVGIRRKVAAARISDQIKMTGLDLCPGVKTERRQRVKATVYAIEFITFAVNKLSIARIQTKCGDTSLSGITERQDRRTPGNHAGISEPVIETA
jgi:hypothetical protein